MADEFLDLLEWLDQSQRRGLISRLSVGFYEGWRPGRGEITDLVAVDLGMIDWEEQLHRSRQRKTGHPGLVDFTRQDFSEHRRRHILATSQPRTSGRTFISAAPRTSGAGTLPTTPPTSRRPAASGRDAVVPAVISDPESSPDLAALA